MKVFYNLYVCTTSPAQHTCYNYGTPKLMKLMAQIGNVSLLTFDMEIKYAFPYNYKS